MAAKLFVNKVCPYAQRAYFLSMAKGLVENKTLIIEDVPLPTPKWYNETINPREMLPALQIVETKECIPESLIIAQYIDEAYPVAPRLFPANNPKQSADVRLFVTEADNAIGGLYGILFTKSEEEVASKWKSSADDLKFLEGLYEKSQKSEGIAAGPFFLGDTLSFADITIAPFLFRFQYTLKEFKGIELLKDVPRLAAMLKAVEAMPSFLETTLNPQELIEAYKVYMSSD